MKNYQSGFYIRNNHLKILFLMICMVTLALSLRANVTAQTKINLNLKSVTFNDLFLEIQKQTKMNFVFNADQLKEVGKIDLTAKDESINSLLERVLTPFSFTYVIEGTTIVIVRKDKENRAQEQPEMITIRGKVTDSDGNALIGATIRIKGTAIGTATDVNGEYKLSVPTEQKELLVTYMGYIDQVVKVNGRTVINIILKEDRKEMEEVVVTGYQSVRRERLTGSTKTITAREMEGKGLTSVEEALSSTVAGLNMISTGRPGQDAKIQIRGINSLNGSTEPIWIVDGMPMQGEIPNIKIGSADLQSTIFTSGIGNLSPNDIKSITVLKDAAATAIYGARAANGVIVIETKQGLVGKTRFNFSLNYGITERPVNNIHMMNTAQKIQFEREFATDEASWLYEPGQVMNILRMRDMGKYTTEEAEAKIAELGKIDTDWFKEIFRTAISQQYNFSMSGGSEKTQHYTSVNYLTEEGTVPNNTYSRLGMSSKITHSPSEKIRITGGLSVTYKKDQITASLVNPLEYAMYANPYERLYNPDGSYASDITYAPNSSSLHPGLQWSTFNIMKEIKENTQNTRYIDADISMKVEWEIIKGLMFTTHGIYNVNSNHDRTVEGPGTYTNYKNNWYQSMLGWSGEMDPDMAQGSLRESTSYSNSYTLKNTLSYSKDFLDTHFLNLFIGQEIMERQSKSFYNYSPIFDEEHNIIGFPELTGIAQSDINLLELGNTGKEVSRLSSFYANLSYSYKDRYIVTGSMRYDGSDVIGNKNQFTPLWNVALRWNVHKERFLETVSWINMLSFRGGFGYTGSIDKNALPFLVYTLNKNIKYDGQLVPQSFTYPNPNIKWQTKRDMNVGLDLSLFDYRVELNLNYYYNITRDVLDKKHLAISSGREEATANVANLHNKGIEIDLGITLLKMKRLQWFANFNIAYNKNTVKDTYYKSVDDLPTKISQEEGHQFVEDKPAGGWYGYRVAGINPMTGTTLVHKNSNDATYDMATNFYDIPGDMVSYLGDSNPHYVGGFSTTVNFRQFVFSANFEFKTGHMIRSFNTFKDPDSQNRHVNDLNRWRKPGDITNVPRLTQLKGLYTFYMFDWGLEKGDYLKCGYVSLGYNLPLEWLEKIGFNSARLSFTAKDLFTITSYKGIDPLLMGEFGYPNSRKYTFTLNFGF